MESINSLLSNEDIEKIVKMKIGNESFSIYNVTLRAASDKKTGFVCDYQKLAISVSAEGHTEKCNFFLKSLPFDNESKQKMIKEYDLFAKEEIVYDLMERMGDALGDQLWFPRLFIANSSVLVFEDLNLRGFSSQDPRSVFTKEHCLTALDSLAKQHAASIIYEEKRSRELGSTYRLVNEYAKYADPGMFAMEGFYETSMTSTLVLVEKFSKYAGDVEKLDIIKSKWKAIWTENLEYALPSSVYRNVLAQRDLWGRNLMYRYENEIPKECLIIDYQVIGFLPPVSDLSSLLYLTLSKEQRMLIEREMIEYFYEKLRQHIKRNNLDMDELLPKAIFLESFEKYRRWGVLHACVELNMMLLPDKYMEEILTEASVMNSVMMTLEGRLELVLKMFNEDCLYRQRSMECLEELIDEYILI